MEKGGNCRLQRNSIAHWRSSRWSRLEFRSSLYRQKFPESRVVAFFSLDSLIFLYKSEICFRKRWNISFVNFSLSVDIIKNNYIFIQINVSFTVDQTISFLQYFEIQVNKLPYTNDEWKSFHLDEWHSSNKAIILLIVIVIGCQRDKLKRPLSKADNLFLTPGCRNFTSKNGILLQWKYFSSVFSHKSLLSSSVGIRARLILFFIVKLHFQSLWRFHGNF